MLNLGRIKNILLQGEDIFPYMFSPSGFIPQIFLEKHLKKDSKVLIIGNTGNNYNIIKSNVTTDLYIIDICKDKTRTLKNYTQQSITERTMFKSNYFDYVVLFDVLEHCVGDHLALDEIRRILKHKGKLILSLPLHCKSDSFTCHFRTYTHTTIYRLCLHTGLRIKKTFFRGVICRLSEKNWTKPIIYLPLLFMTHERFRTIIFRLENYFSEFTHSLFLSYGIYITAEKCRPVKDVNVNLEKYSGQ